MNKFRESIAFRIIAVVILLVLPLNILTVVFLHRVIADSDERMNMESRSSLSVSSSYLKGQLKSVTRRLLYENVINNNFSELADKDGKVPLNTKGEIVQTIGKLFDQILDEYEVIDLVYCRFPDSDIFITKGSPGASREEYKKAIEDTTTDVSSKYGTVWKIIEMENTPYLISLTRWKDREFGCMLNLRKTGDHIVNYGGAEDKYFFFTDSEMNMTPVSNIEALNSIFISVDEKDGHDELTRDGSINGEKYRFYGENLEGYGIMMVQAVPRSGIIAGLSKESIILIFIAIVLTAMAIPIMLLMLRRLLFVPVSKINLGMRRIENGEIDYRLDEKMGSAELSGISHSFNEMMDELENLKIDVYEKELERKDITTRYLAKQIQPHFILNALNILYSYEPEEYELSRKMILSISKYFRYVVYVKNRFVTLSQEMDFVKNYLDIQHIRYPDQFFSIVEYEEELADYLMPPLIVQSLTENAIKHSLKIGNRINIFVITDHITDCGTDKIRIRIYDTGEGITDEILEEIRIFQRTGEPQEHLGVGIQNTIERLKVLYSDMTTIKFERDNASGGTNIDILLPMIKENSGSGDYAHETASC